MALANINNQKRQILSGLLADRPTAAVYYGDTYYATDNGLWYIYTPSGWVIESLPGIIAAIATLPGTVQADIAAMKADTALIKAQNQTAKATSHSFIFDADDLIKTGAITYNGLVKNLHLIVPTFTNVITATLTLVDGGSRVIWTSAAKAMSASYNLNTDAEWFDQLVDATCVWTVTLSGVAGGTGGTVVLVPRYYGV